MLAFDYSHREIAEILHIDEFTRGSSFHRARAHMATGRKRFTAKPEHGKEMVERFLAATLTGDLSGLEQLLAEDVVAWFDGGGRVGAARPPMVGRDRVGRYLIRWLGHPRAASAEITIGSVNGVPAVLAREAGELTCIIVPEIADRGIIAVCTIANPDKLAFAARQL